MKINIRSFLVVLLGLGVIGVLSEFLKPGRDHDLRNAIIIIVMIIVFIVTIIKGNTSNKPKDKNHEN